MKIELLFDQLTYRAENKFLYDKFIYIGNLLFLLAMILFEYQILSGCSVICLAPGSKQGCNEQGKFFKSKSILFNYIRPFSVILGFMASVLPEGVLQQYHVFKNYFYQSFFFFLIFDLKYRECYVCNHIFVIQILDVGQVEMNDNHSVLLVVDCKWICL